MSWQPPEIEEGKLTKWNWMVQSVENFKLGKNTDIGAFTYIQAGAGVTIEDDVQIGGGTFIYSISTIDNKRGPVLIKKGARIGAQCTIMPGVTIGQKAIVAAHSFVNENVPKGRIVWGVPAN